MIKVIIVEDQEFTRTGLVSIIDADDNFESVGAFPDCESMLEEIEELQPDVMIMDIGLPGISGIEGIKKVKELSPKVNIVVLTIHEESNKVFEALVAGASGYLMKTTPPEEILLSLKDAVEGGSPMNSHIANKVVNLLRSVSDKNEENKILLSERENEVLTDLSKGLGYKQISANLFISIHTVRYHIRNIYDKLHVGSQSEAVATAIKRGLI